MSAVLEPRTSISPEPPPAVTTGVDSGSPVTRGTHAEAWQRFIVQKLIEWGTDPNYFADEEFDGPLPEIVSLALRHAQYFRDKDWAPPHRVVPDADGGIVFEINGDGLSEKIHFWDDGEVEYMVFQDGRILKRHPLQLAWT